VLVVSDICAERSGLDGLETEAREARQGLRVDPQPMPPWEWRKRSR
jgi:endonuclease YncB( thermonuclease family)